MLGVIQNELIAHVTLITQEVGEKRQRQEQEEAQRK